MLTRKRQGRQGRQGPSSSATLFAVGTIRTGNDGNKWRIESNKNGVNRWVRIGNKSVTQRNKVKVKLDQTSFSSNTHPKDYVSFNVLTKQSKACAEDCNLFINENLLDDIWWKMFNPASDDGEYDTAIPFRGPPESLQAAIAIVKAEYSKIKAKGDITKFKIDLSGP
jgi:hypothetical protein